MFLKCPAEQRCASCKIAPCAHLKLSDDIRRVFKDSGPVMKKRAEGKYMSFDELVDDLRRAPLTAEAPAMPAERHRCNGHPDDKINDCSGKPHGCGARLPRAIGDDGLPVGEIKFCSQYFESQALRKIHQERDHPELAVVVAQAAAEPAAAQAPSLAAVAAEAEAVPVAANLEVRSFLSNYLVLLE